MIGLKNRDSVFYTIESPDISLTDKNLSRYVKSLTITESMNAMPTGTISFNDPDNLLSRILRRGARLKLSWGYKDFGVDLKSLLPTDLNQDEITGALIRRGFEVYIYNPSGGADANGIKTYNCNFTALNFRGFDQTRDYMDGNKGTVIDQAFDEIGISSTKRYINFARQSEPVTKTSPIRQDETTFLFLTRLAAEWQAVFFLTFLQDGGIGGIFTNAYNLKYNQSIPLWVFKSIGNSHYLDYQGSVNNVISYTWESNEGENGIGDNTQLEIINGEIVFRQFQADNEKVTTYRIDHDKIRREFQKQDENLEQIAKFTIELLSKNTFEQVKHYFIPVESSTAPQGYGYRIKAKIIGNPLFCPPNQVKIGKGFPDQIGGSQSIWYINTVTHMIDINGYSMDIEVVDAFNLSPIGQVIL